MGFVEFCVISVMKLFFEILAELDEFDIDIFGIGLIDSGGTLVF